MWAPRSWWVDDHEAEHRLVGADRGHVGAGEHADRVGRGDIREIGIADRQIALTPQRLLQQQARRQVRLDRDGLALEVAHRLDGAIRRPTVAAGGDVDRADDDALRVLAPAEALVLAHRAQVTVDVAALHRGYRVRHVVVQDLDDRDALVREIAELVGQMHRAEADPHRVGAGDGVRLAHRGMGVRRPDAATRPTSIRIPVPAPASCARSAWCLLLVPDVSRTHVSRRGSLVQVTGPPGACLARLAKDEADRVQPGRENRDAFARLVSESDRPGSARE